MSGELYICLLVKFSADLLSYSEVLEYVENPRIGNKPNGVLDTLHDDLVDLINEFDEIDNPEETIVLKTSTKFNIESLSANTPEGQFTNIINLKRINDILELNDFLGTINGKLRSGGYFIGCVETSEMRTSRILNKYIKPFAYLYLVGDFIFKRVIPKLPLLSRIYFALTNGRNRVMTQVEILGRLYYCGFEVVKIKKIDKYLIFAVKKVEHREHVEEKMYGPTLKLPRIGYLGKPINVYKMRTMHAYSEYLQEYIYKKNNLAEGGKIRNDFRVTIFGKYMRKIWLDELPMIYNFLKGEIKLVGVRPLSAHFLSLYPPEFIETRKEVKPGLVPPFYADLPKTLEEVIESEKRYIAAYKNAPLKTDIRYLATAFKNIFFEKARSN